jgi:hypothetical protein
VEGVFTPPAEPAHHGIGRGDRQGHQQHEGSEARRDERPLHDVLKYGGHVEELVQPQVGHQVQATVEECGQPEHAAQAQQPVHAGQPAQRRDRQRHQQQDQRPFTGRAGDELDRVGTETAGECASDQSGQWHLLPQFHPVAQSPTTPNRQNPTPQQLQSLSTQQ